MISVPAKRLLQGHCSPAVLLSASLVWQQVGNCTSPAAFPACGSQRSPDNGRPSVPPWHVIDPMNKPSSKTDETSFEDAMQRLDEIVAGMEDGQLSL